MEFFKNLKYTFERQGILTKIIIINTAIFLTVNLVANMAHQDLLQYLALPLGGEDFLPRF